MNSEVERALKEHEAERAREDAERARRAAAEAHIQRCLEARCCPECAGALARWGGWVGWIYQCSVCGWQHKGKASQSDNLAAYYRQMLHQATPSPQQMGAIGAPRQYTTPVYGFGLQQIFGL